LRNIILEIEKYHSVGELLKRESFWRSFISKVRVGDRVEDQLWDLKETLEMWHVGGSQKENAEAKFCEEVAAFANAKGGAIIIGITDKIPKIVVGVNDLENRIKSIREVIRRYIKPDSDLVHLQQVLLKDDEDRDKTCLVIAVAQTRSGISVKDRAGRFSYPIRMGTGLSRIDHEDLVNLKRNVLNDNYHFIRDLDRLLYDR
jgi:predicted HTH transcriptional regulator